MPPGPHTKPAGAALLTAEEFAARLETLSPAGPVGVAVSGGADSMALLRLTAHWAGDRVPVRGFTVDHGLRPNSAAEAAQVAAWCHELGIPHEILAWRGRKPHSGIQAAARSARYRLLVGACRRRGVRELLVAHTQDDQAETLLLRLLKGSGINGLAGMAPVSELDGIRLLRPLLDVPKARLVATLKAAGQAWIEDPSNDDSRFQRVRIRRAFEALAEASDEPARIGERIAASAARIGRARAALDAVAGTLYGEVIKETAAGFAWLTVGPFAAAPPEMAHRVLERVLMRVGALDYPPRSERQNRVLQAVVNGTVGRGRTLAGCRIMPASGELDRLIICREAAAVGPPVRLKPGGRARFDGRFDVRLSRKAAAGGDVAALGRNGWQQIKDDLDPARACEIPAPVRPTLPALWRQGRVVAAPALGFERERSATGRSLFHATFDPVKVLNGSNKSC